MKVLITDDSRAVRQIVTRTLRRSAVPFGLVTSEGSPARRAEAPAAGVPLRIAELFTGETFREALEPVP
jgi:hypothetical protein